MDTPTSQAQPKPLSLTLDSSLSQLSAGTFTFRHLASFSDLSREQVRKVERVWASIDHDLRRRLVSDAIELAEANVEYQFNRLLRLALQDDDADIRQLAIAGLWEDETASLQASLLELARNDNSDDVRAAAIGFLGDALQRMREHEDDVEALRDVEELVIAFAQDENLPAIVRRRAIEAIGALDQNDETRRVIQDAFDFGDQTLEAGALVAMGRAMESRWRTFVLGAVESEDAELRYEACRALGLIGLPDDVEDLAPLTIDEDAEVRRAAIVALGEIGSPGAVRVLRDLANQADDTEKEAIEEALDNALLGNDPLRTSS